MSKYVLMLEDDNDDRYITSETLSELGIDIEIKFFSNSNEVFKFLSTSEKPVLMLIDFNATPENGIEVLKKLKSNEQYKEIPVVILSDNNIPQYRTKAYSNGAASFIKKPDTHQQTREKIETFFRYWFEVAEV
jgi:CheY-like chemotaxis protein